MQTKFCIENWALPSQNKQKEPNLFACRCSWGVRWHNRTARTPWPANDIWSAAWRGGGDAPAGRHPRIPGDSCKNQQQEGGLAVGHCHWSVGVSGGLQHRPVLRSLLWPGTASLPLQCTGLRRVNGSPAHWWKQVKEKQVGLQHTDKESTVWL